MLQLRTSGYQRDNCHNVTPCILQPERWQHTLGWTRSEVSDSEDATADLQPHKLVQRVHMGTQRWSANISDMPRSTLFLHWPNLSQSENKHVWRSVKTREQNSVQRSVTGFIQLLIHGQLKITFNECHFNLY